MYSYIHVYGHYLVISGMCSHWFFCARCVCLWSTPPGTGQLLFLCGVHSIWDWPSSHQGPAVKQATLSASCMQATHIYICIYIYALALLIPSWLFQKMPAAQHTVTAIRDQLEMKTTCSTVAAC